MKKNTLGNTGLEITEVSLGTAFVGSDRERGEPVSEEAIAAGRAILNSPFTITDTSNSYGHGRSEIALGHAVRANGGLAEGSLLITKSDRDRDTGVFTGERALRSFEESVQRLGVEYFPIYQLHDPYSITFEEAMAPGGAVSSLIRLREEGLVGHLGIAAGPLSLLERYLDTGVFDVVLTHNRYTLLNRSAEPFIERAHERGIGVFNAAPFGGGLLASGAREGASYAYEPASAETLAWLERLDAVCAEWQVDLRAAALHFSLRNPLISSTVIGTARASRVPEFEALVEARIPEGFWDAVAALGTPPTSFGTD